MMNYKVPKCVANASILLQYLLFQYYTIITVDSRVIEACFSICSLELTIGSCYGGTQLTSA